MQSIYFGRRTCCGRLGALANTGQVHAQKRDNHLSQTANKHKQEARANQRSLPEGPQLAGCWSSRFVAQRGGAAAVCPSCWASKRLQGADRSSCSNVDAGGLLSPGTWLRMRPFAASSLRATWPRRRAIRDN